MCFIFELIPWSVHNALEAWWLEEESDLQLDVSCVRARDSLGHVLQLCGWTTELEFPIVTLEYK